MTEPKDTQPTEKSGERKTPVDETAAPAEARAPDTSTPARRRGKPANWPKEIGGPSGPEPTRYGDWERKGIVSDF